VVVAVHEQHVRRGGVFGARVAGFADVCGGLVGVRRDGHGVVVPVGEEDAEDLGAVGRLPDQFGLEPFGLGVVAVSGLRVRLVDSPAEDGGVDAEALEDLRHLGDVAEGVRDVPDHGRAAEARRHVQAVDEVADGGLAAHEELVGLHVPGSDGELPGGDGDSDLLLVLGADLEVVLEDDGLPVEVEVLEVRAVLEGIEERIQELDEPMRDDVDGVFGHFLGLL